MIGTDATMLSWIRDLPPMPVLRDGQVVVGQGDGLYALSWTGGELRNMNLGQLHEAVERLNGMPTRRVNPETGCAEARHYPDHCAPYWLPIVNWQVFGNYRQPDWWVGLPKCEPWTSVVQMATLTAGPRGSMGEEIEPVVVLLASDPGDPRYGDRGVGLYGYITDDAIHFTGEVWK